MIKRVATLAACILLFVTSDLARTLKGSVLNSINGLGIPGVEVEIIRLPAGDVSFSTTTDGHGIFQIESVESGSYAARYLSRAYKPKLLENRQLFQMSGGTVTLTAYLVPLSNLKVRVFDNRDVPVLDANFELADSQTRIRMPVAERGEFVSHLVPPGTYLLSVIPPGSLKPPTLPVRNGGNVLQWSKTFYPGVTSRDSAAELLLAPGEVRDIEIKLQTVAAHAVRGVLVNSNDMPAPGIPITLSQDVSSTLKSREDGSFEFPLVKDGEWRLTAAVGGQEVSAKASQWIEMAGQDIEGLKLRLVMPFALTGSVVLEIPQGTPTMPTPRVFLIPHSNREEAPTALLETTGLQAHPAEDGSFVLNNVYPGAYRVEDEERPPAPYYLDAIRVGNTDVGNREIDLLAPLPIELVYKTNGGIVRGQVNTTKPCGVWLVPQDEPHRGRSFLRSSSCNSEGRFQIDAVRPGDYYLVAFAGDDIPWYRALADDTLHKRATTVTARTGETVTAEAWPLTP
jgi:hypothetical protein